MSKPKLSEKQFFLVLNGPSCGGKSSISDLLCEQYGGIYKGKSDVIKWLISDYDPNIHREIVHEMTLETMRVALSHGFSIVKEGGSWHAEKYVEMAKAANVSFFVANIEAPWDVLQARFEQRIENKKQGARVANVDPERFKALYDMYMNFKAKTELEFDSSKQTPEEITKAIAEYIKSHI